jgi:hypothetical protein
MTGRASTMLFTPEKLACQGLFLVMSAARATGLLRENLRGGREEIPCNDGRKFESPARC